MNRAPLLSEDGTKRPYKLSVPTTIKADYDPALRGRLQSEDWSERDLSQDPPRDVLSESEYQSVVDDEDGLNPLPLSTGRHLDRESISDLIGIALIGDAEDSRSVTVCDALSVSFHLIGDAVRREIGR